jgi:hypothetical protein
MKTQFFSENLKERDHLGHLGIEETTTLKWFLKQQGVKTWTRIIWSRTRTNEKLL